MTKVMKRVFLALTSGPIEDRLDALMFVFMAIWAGIFVPLLITWILLETFVFETNNTLIPLELHLEVTEVVTKETSRGTEVIGVRLQTHTKGYEPGFKYPYTEHQSEHILSQWFGEDFAQKQFRYGEKFIARCDRTEKRHVLLRNEVVTHRPCTIELSLNEPAAFRPREFFWKKNFTSSSVGEDQ